MTAIHPKWQQDVRDFDLFFIQELVAYA